MKVSLNWLRDYVELPDDVDEIVAALASLGLPPEDALHLGGVPGVVTARVLRTERHPDAAKVQRVWVDAGDGSERHVWCGAFNFQAGDVVPLATVGTEMPDGRSIASRGILGIDSHGMLCSARELGLGEDHSGILVLPADSPLGVPYGQVTGLADDVVLELEIERNRPDAYGHVGIARDLAAHFGTTFAPPQPTVDVAGEERAVPVEIVAGDACGRFTTTVMSGVAVRQSAPWMQARLRAVGQRPINNVVDVSNYVMLELNQPNHAYDLATLGRPAGSQRHVGAAIRVRHAADGEQLVTIDEMKRTLTAAELLICDGADVPIGLAGIMGGADSEISEATTTVALEVAWFEPLGIAASVARTGLRSDASARNERGVDPYTIPTAIARFAELLAETCPDLVVHAGGSDARAAALPDEQRSCTLRVSQVGRIVGVDLDPETIAGLLDPIGLTVHGRGEEMAVSLPSWRPDCNVEIDVIEEIARRYGYEHVPRRVPLSPNTAGLTVVQQRRRLVREVLVGLGVSEVMPSPFLSPGDVIAAALDEGVLHVTNPLVAADDVLRPSLRPGLLKSIAFNESHRRTGVSLFELGHVYAPGPGELPAERETLGVVLAGQEAPAAVAVWRELAAALGIGARLDQDRVPAGLHVTRAATLVAGRDTIGTVGEVAPEVLEAFGIHERVALVELDLDGVLASEPKPARWRATSRHPSSDLDLALALPEDVPAEKLDKAIRQGAGGPLVAAELFDVYRGPNVPAGTRGLAYRLRLQAPDRTLTDADTAAVVAGVTAAAAKLGATLRA